METLFDPESPRHFAARIEALSPASQAEWGEMNVQEMLKHTSTALGIGLATKTMKRTFIGRLLGGIGKRMWINSGKPFAKNGPTDPRLKFKIDSVNEAQLEEAKQRLIGEVAEFHQRGATGMPETPHPFFGKLTPDEWDRLMAKHIDHHLRQFGC